MQLKIVDSVINLLCEIETHKQYKYDYIYRGESKKYDQPCTPKIFRRALWEKHKQPYLLNDQALGSYEQGSIHDWIIEVEKSENTLIPLINKDIEQIIFAQHYGLATRLLDWTSNPLVALWFACEANKDSDGYIYFTKVPEEGIGGFTFWETGGSSESFTPPFPREVGSNFISSAMDFDRRNAIYKNPHCLNNITIGLIPYKRIHFFKLSRSSDKRLIRQSSVFSLHPNTLHTIEPEKVYCIKQDSKEYFLKELARLGVSSSSLGLDTRESLAKRYSLVLNRL